jgi:hypothetical protein
VRAEIFKKSRRSIFFTPIATNGCLQNREPAHDSMRAAESC